MDGFTTLVMVKKGSAVKQWWAQNKDISFTLVAMLLLSFVILLGLNFKAAGEITRAKEHAERARVAQIRQDEKEKEAQVEQKKELVVATVEITAQEVKKVEQVKTVVKRIQAVAAVKTAVVQMKTPAYKQVHEKSVIAVDALWDTYCALESNCKE